MIRYLVDWLENKTRASLDALSSRYELDTYRGRLMSCWFETTVLQRPCELERTRKRLYRLKELSAAHPELPSEFEGVSLDEMLALSVLK